MWDGTNNWQENVIIDLQTKPLTFCPIEQNIAKAREEEYERKYGDKKERISFIKDFEEKAGLTKKKVIQKLRTKNRINLQAYKSLLNIERDLKNL